MAGKSKVFLEAILGSILALFAIGMFSSVPSLLADDVDLISLLFVIGGFLFAIYPVYLIYKVIKFYK